MSEALKAKLIRILQKVPVAGKPAQAMQVAAMILKLRSA